MRIGRCYVRIDRCLVRIATPFVRIGRCFVQIATPFVRIASSLYEPTATILNLSDPQGRYRCHPHYC